MLTPKQRAFLRSKSHNLQDLVYIGKDGVTENVIEQINKNLYAHELIKIKVQNNSPSTPREFATEIEEITGSETVGVVGNKIILYKLTTKPNFKHYL